MTARAALRRLRRSIALATGQIERAGRHGRSVGTYVCATVELRVDDLRALVALAERAAEAERLRKALRWAAYALESARTEGLLGFDGADPTDTERAAEVEFQENMAPIRDALAPPRAGKKRRWRRPLTGSAPSCAT